MKNSDEGYALPHIVIHWLVAATILGLFVLGLWMVTLSYYSPWYHRAPLIHQSIGLVLVITMLFRLFWRRYAGMPRHLPSHQRWEKRLASLVHGVLYLLTISMFFSGYLIATAKGQPINFFGIDLPAVITGVDNMEDYAANVHEKMAFSIIIIASLHGLAAIKHHILDKDVTLRRMLKPIKH